MTMLSLARTHPKRVMNWRAQEQPQMTRMSGPLVHRRQYHLVQEVRLMKPIRGRVRPWPRTRTPKTSDNGNPYISSRHRPTAESRLMIMYHESRTALARFVAHSLPAFEHVHICEPSPWIRSGSSSLMLNPVGSVRKTLCIAQDTINILLLDIRFVVYMFI